MAMTGAQRHARWRARHRDYVRQLQFKCADLEELLKERDERIMRLLLERRERNRADRNQSLIDSLKDVPADGEKPD
jgi:hypothetical protein